MTSSDPKPPARRAASARKAAPTLQNDPLDWIGAPPQNAPPPTEAAMPAPVKQPDMPSPSPISSPPGAPTPDERTPMMATATQSKDGTMLWQTLPTATFLDLLINPIMIADETYTIRFANKAAFRMFEELESDIRKDLPHFRASDVVGKNVDIFHKNPHYQRRIMDTMNRPHDGGFTIGGRTLKFIATPLFDDGKVSSVIVEWRDDTANVAAANDLKTNREQFDALLAQMTHMAKEHDRGEIDVYLDPEAFLSPEVRSAAALVNKMVSDHIGTKKRVIEVFRAFGEGDFDAPFEQMPGKKAFLNDAVETVRGSLRLLTVEITKLSDQIVAGNLDAEIDVSKFRGQYRTIVQSFERAYSSLNSALSVISEQVGQVSQTVGQMQRSSEALSTNSQIASSSVDEVSSSAEETDAQVKANAEASKRAAKSVYSASQFATEGADKIRAMVSAMDGIKTSSQDIGKIIKVIDEIAFQTNLLALNAAVEAARAGQHGRGFAVVAQEVRNLAGRSAKAARETSELIEDASNRVNAGVRIADDTAEAFTRIAGEVQQVKEVVEAIDRASEEQARGVAQISQAITEIAKTTLSTSKQADSLAATSAQMNAATQQMSAEISRYKLRKTATAAAQITDLSQLPPELLAQIQRMMGAPNGSVRPNGRNGSVDQDARGYGPF
jgi:methyl-accepting chemotaxis protein